jgi:leader peptidase (prepilin peptidase)/N-methyltransferase
MYLLVHLMIPAGLGAGDVKLALGVGGLTGAFGPDVWLLAALGAPLLTALLAAVLAVRDRTATVPHGPSMCLASLASAALAVF